MGFRGLTTFIESEAHLYLQDYKLHDTTLVIDGCATACHLYCLCNSNMCFGGDYDKYGNSIKDFFKTLSKCNITPYVVFDGGNESGEMTTTIERMKRRIETAEQMSSAGRKTLFPLFLRQTFYDTGFELGIKMIQCDFKSDIDIKKIARRLDCPVLSSDSDFYIFDGLYIPLNKLDMTVRSAVDINTKSTYHYLGCSVYNVDKFLNYHGLRSRSILPLLAVLLGNEDVKKNLSSMLRQNVRVQRNPRWRNSASQNHIRSVLMWLRKETVDSAITKVLQQYPKNNRKEILDIINEASNGFNSCESIYLNYFGISPPEIKSKQKLINLEKFIDMVGSIECKKDRKLCLGSKSDQELSFTEIDEKSIQFPSIFIDNFRRCLYPHYFVDIFLRHQYYYATQVEDVTLDSVIKTCFDIIGAIFKILTGHGKGLQCIGRVGRTAGKMDVPSYSDPLPSLDDIQKMNNDEKQKIFFKILKFDNTLKHLLDSFPTSWHIYILAIIYTANKSKMQSSLKYALILSRIILSCIDYKIGFIRSEILLTEKYSTELNQSVETADKVTVPKKVSECLSNISTSDSVQSIKSLLKYFEMDRQLACSSRYFDRKLVHSISEFQIVLLHLKYLNNILQKPFPDFNISDSLNCTFVYNFTANLTKQSDIKDFLDTLLSNSPNVLRTVHLIIDTLSEYRCPLLPLSNALEELAL